MDPSKIVSNDSIPHKSKNDYPGSILHKIRLGLPCYKNPIPRRNIGFESQGDSPEGKMEIVQLSLMAYLLKYLG